MTVSAGAFRRPCPLLPHDRHRLRQQPARISARPTRRSRPTSSPATSGWPGSTSGSSWATTSTRRTCSARRASWTSIRSPTATGWSRSSATVWARLDISFDDFIRTTEPRHRARRRRRCVAALARGRRHLRRRLRGLVLRLLRGVQAGKGPRRRAVSDPPDASRSGSRSATTSSACRRTAIGCSQHYATHPEFVEPESRRNEMLRLLEGGLEDISVSRAGQSWGIPLPFDPSSVVYVWYDALINYAAAVGYGTRSGDCSTRGGRRTCTSSARTSRGSTASSGRRC